ncbi:MAG: hypothetical protein COA91_06445 [Robiginitomaculum sp.]|nr:MAG: hypothetical protein COA91_06445 [Robiginitomaculum sp.]
MKLATSFITIFMISGLGACSTVDLSQVAIEKPQNTARPAHNVVERSSISLTSLFRSKGWSKSGPEEKTNTATRVFLGGLEKNHNNTPKDIVVTVNMAQLDADILEANTQIRQTSKAAEVYLTIAEIGAELDDELSLLEGALLAAREAQSGFESSIGANPSVKLQQDFELFSSSVGRLKDITDAYGDRIRAQIIARASASAS